MSANPSSEALRLENITKVYGNGILANDGINLTVNSGEIHAICGENGAGKSTLMKIIFGIESPSRGVVYVNGSKVDIKSPKDAIEKGIGMVHQHFMLVPSLTVAENIMLGIEPKTMGFVMDQKEAVRLTLETSRKYNLELDPNAIVEDLSVGQKQKIELVKALIRGAKILILDEPTAVLTPQETEQLFKELINLKKEGHTILFISHKLVEVKTLCDRVSIMRNGKMGSSHRIDEVSEEDISKLMIGTALPAEVSKAASKFGDVVLNVENLVHVNAMHKKTLKGVQFNVRSGQILGVAGVEGNGQREMVEIITGLLDATEGQVSILGENLSKLSIKQRRDKGLAYVPEDRMTFGCAKDMSIRDNVLSTWTESKRFVQSGFLKKAEIEKFAADSAKEYRVKCKDASQEVGMLSGGNIQKVVIAREMSQNPKLLVADQPTRGIDVGSSRFIREKIVTLRDQGGAVLLVSADLRELLEISDGIIVMYNGEITAYFESLEGITEHDLGYYMLGVKKQDHQDIVQAFARSATKAGEK